MLNLLTFVEVMKSIGGGVLAIVLFLVMIMIHEFGHYVAGKALGFKIMEFSIGFGPAIFQKRSKKTGELFAIRAIPLGGYCAAVEYHDIVRVGGFLHVVRGKKYRHLLLAAQ